MSRSGRALLPEKIRTSRASLEAFSWQRFSTRQDRPINMDGLVGEMTYLAISHHSLPF